MRTRQELEFIKLFIDRAYNNYGNLLRVKTDKPYSSLNPSLGYSYKYTTVDKTNNQRLVVYNIVTAPIGIERTDFRILLHEYGHIYLAHLDGIYEELDVNICNVFKERREEIIDKLNKDLGITWAERLIERVIDDKVLNHSLHNIAMDMEVNTKVLSTEDINEMETDISSKMPDFQEQRLKNLVNDPEVPEEIKKAAQQKLDKLSKEAKVKLICPCRYHTSDGKPFPDELTYLEYLIMIIKNLDQFVKMMISINNGGNGDTSKVTQEEVQKALSGGEQTLDDLMESMGMSNSSNKKGKAGGTGQMDDSLENSGQQSASGGLGQSDTSNVGGKTGTNDVGDSPYNRNHSFSEMEDYHMDHGTGSRDEADVKREAGQIVAGGGLGCSSSGAAGVLREVIKGLDPVDEAIDEVIRTFKSRVIKRDLKKDSTWYWNRGINRSVLAPAYRNQVTISEEPKIVYLIDISGSMNTALVDRILETIARKMKHCGTGRGLKYDIISWSTRLGEHIKDIDPRNGVPKISSGGGTWMAGGMKYYKEHYDENSILVLISDFCDDLNEWNRIAGEMPGYTMWGFNYGGRSYSESTKFVRNFKVRNFNDR